jgi:ligand-binding sensor domain-containing protein/signal transduction histidine kinase/DNA-binding response OmpR family regulator
MIIIFLLLSNYAAWSQKQNLLFHQLGTADGLSQNSISCIFQDHKGFLWFGTRDGLNKYDGYKFTTFRKIPGNQNSLSSNNIRAIIEDRNGTIWIGTWDGGLNKFDPSSEKFTRYLQYSAHNQTKTIDNVTCLTRDKAGKIWVGTEKAGLLFFDESNKQFKSFTHLKGTEHISAVLAESNSDIWIGTPNGIWTVRNKGKNIQHYEYSAKDPGTLSCNDVRFLFEDREHQIWAGTYGGGLNLFNKQNNSFRSFKESITSNKQSDPNFLLSVAEDSRGNLWMGTENAGLRIFDPNTGKTAAYLHTDYDNATISGNTITTLLKDAKGNIWMGTLNGINMVNIDETRFNHFRHQPGVNSLSDDNVICLYEDSAKNLWIGTDGGGLNRLDRKTGLFTWFRHQPGQSNSICGNFIKSVCEDSRGNLWIGTWGNGLTVYNPKKGTYKHYQNHSDNAGSLANNNAWYIYKDKKNNIWICTYGGGLDRYNPKTDDFTHYKYQDNLPSAISSNYILTITEDHLGKLWIGTDGGGLNQLDPQTGKFRIFKKENDPNALQNNSVGSIIEDNKGYIWAGTNYGLSRYNTNTGKFTTYLTGQGLLNDLVTGIIEDNKNQLWVTSVSGLSILNLGNYSFKNYTTADGLRSSEIRAHLQAKNGMMYFGGKNGFNEFAPSSIRNTPFNPPLVFTGFQIFNKPVSIAKNEDDPSPLKTAITNIKELYLTYKQSVFSLEFASLNYTNKEKKQYAYMLEGFDLDWNYIGSKNTVMYTNLNPGSYTLKIKGLNNEKEWSVKTAQLQIHISPPYWQTTWFKILAFLLITLIIVLLFYARVASIKQRNKQLEQEVAGRTKELTETNTILSESNEEIRLQNEKLESFNEETLRQTDKILEQQKQIIVQNQELESTVQKLERLNQTKDRFFSILAHDLKNPVYALSGISDLLHKNIDKLSREEVKNYILSIYRSSGEVYTLLVNLLDWATTQLGSIRYIGCDLNLMDLLQKNSCLLNEQLKKKNISLYLHISPAHAVHADLQMINTVFRNLISNSIKFTPQGGNITISSSDDKDFITVVLQDTGIGMNPEQLDHLFNIEKDHISKGTEGETGTGLGLIICKEFLEACSSKISVKSKPGHGSTFTITLPKASVYIPPSSEPTTSVGTEAGLADLASHIPEDQLLKIKGKRVLIIDDNKEIREFLRMLLSDTFEIFEAENGLEGLKQALDTQPAVIITDMMMPEMNGLEFCRALKNDAAISHIPVILLTSKSDDSSQLSGYVAGADVYLTKPIKQHMIFQVIYNFIQNQEKLRLKFAQSNEMYPEGLDLNKLDQEFLNNMIAFVEQHLSDEHLDYTTLCEITSMSRSVLYAKFKAITGQGIHDFIKTIRLKKGLQLLMEGRLNITQISYEVGFNTPSYFTKSFIKQYGMTPKEYIANLKKRY